MPGSGDGVRLAVKDLIDVAGVPTTAGSLQLIGGPNAEALLLATGAMIEAATLCSE
jgi:Asp-tRNA(Asn)/Glu-tRNA(Gln) amidotransferase A subunit family amidase